MQTEGGLGDVLANLLDRTDGSAQPTQTREDEWVTQQMQSPNGQERIRLRPPGYSLRSWRHRTFGPGLLPTRQKSFPGRPRPIRVCARFTRVAPAEAVA